MDENMWERWGAASGIIFVVDGSTQGNVAMQAPIHFHNFSFGHLETFGNQFDLLRPQVAIL